MLIKSFHMRTALITGVSKGIGKAEAQKLLAEGFHVFGTSTTGKIDYAHKNLQIIPLDLKSSESIAACASAIAKTKTMFNVVINNAGVLLDDEDTVLIPEKLRATLEVNLIGTAEFTERVLSSVKKEGIIVMTSSTAGSLQLAETADHYPLHYPAYKISKAALNMYMRTLARRLRDTGPIVLSVHPGWVKTDMGGEEADTTPEEAAEDIYHTIVSRPKNGVFLFRGRHIPW
ncbi:TPA: SDR family oxidoreductase [Candidatus Kaiserbacteria bacterium]|nr:MAG: oxidoreductase [Parcubacteria group bacterium GW2011_GWA1_56_13]KKW46735.1 MAG: oxidoreductase [Parcubacteria group bacterium GW2011_GWB1_57_6]HCR52061.1 SDR family oxidoreductase [Candidatus Kaiserbacteria bacterium]